MHVLCSARHGPLFWQSLFVALLRFTLYVKKHMDLYSVVGEHLHERRVSLRQACHNRQCLLVGIFFEILHFGF